MSTQKKLITLCFAAVFTLGLAACGGGGSDRAETPPVVTPPVEMPGPLTPLEQLTAARSAVAAAQALVSSASTPTENAAAYSALAAAQAQLATAESIPENQIALHSQQGLVDEALTAAQAAVDGLSNASTDDEVAAAEAAVAAAQAALDAASALPADDSRHASVMGVSDGLGDALMMRTADMETEAINAMISTAQTAVGGLDRVTSSGADIEAARAAVAAVMAEIAGSTALTEAQKTALSAQISMANTDLGDIDDFRSTADGQLMVAEAALASARELVDLLTPSSTAAEAAAAYGALGAAQVAIHGARNLPANQIAALQKMVDDLTMELGNQNTASTQRTAVTDALADANALIAGLNDESSAEDVAAARAEVEKAQSALAAATGLSQSERDGLTSLVNTANSSVTGYETIVAARPDPMVVMALTEAAKTKTTEIEAEAKQGMGDEPVDAGLGGTAAVDEDTYMLDISREKDMGATIKITDPAMVGEDQPEFVKQDVDLGAKTTMHVREMEADEDDGTVEDEVVVVTTDIDAPRAVAFAKWRDMDGDTPQVLDVMKDDGEAPDMSEDETANALDVVDIDASALVTRMMPVRSISAATVDYSQDNPDEPTMDVDEGLHDGTYNGAEGTFRCTATDAPCTITFDDKGKVSGASDNWVFIPDMDATSDEPDYDYLNYGFWLARTKNADGTVKSYDEVETFADSSITDVSNVADVTGSATYMGGATGVFVKNVHNPDSSIASATSGLFTADAELTAIFGQVLDPDDDDKGTIAANLLDTISGTVSDLRNDADEVINGSWTVNLMKGGIEDAGTFSGMTTGDGTYSGTFHGDVMPVDHDDDPDTDSIVPKPHTVVGEFDAVFSNGSVAGAFGARAE